LGIKVQVKKKFSGFDLDVDFVSSSSRIGILGRSGCGKTVTLKSIAGIQDIDKGYIKVNGNVFVDSKKRINLKPQQRKVGYLFQNYALFPTMSAAKNIMAGLSGQVEEKRIRAAEMIERFHLKGLEDHLPGQLSGGQQQRVALARIMAYEPEMILLDEPFTALDGFLKDRLQQEMLEMLDEYEGIVILVSHNRDEIYRFSEDLLIMEAGKIVCSGETKEVFRNPGGREAASLTGCKNIVPVKRLHDRLVDIPDWGIKIRSTKVLPAEFSYIGYHAHDFIPVWGENNGNSIPFNLKSTAELPFEQQYFLNAQGMEICWFVQRELIKEIESRGLPRFLKIDPEKIVYLN